MDGHISGLVKQAARLTALIGCMGWTAIALSSASSSRDGEVARGRSVAFVEHKAYQTECTPCHLGFLPGFLPARSWTKLMDGLEDHFGENAALDDDVRKDILNYLYAHAADHPSSTKRSKKIAKLTPAEDTPLRITETAFWTRRHGSVRAWVWKSPKVESKAKCNACHRDAEKGLFDEHDVHIPK